LAGKVGISASQIRKDLNLFGSFGQQGYGYRVDELLHELSKILGLTQKISMVMVGAGNLGRAITYYPGFQTEHFQIKAIFDSDPLVIGDSINQCIVRSLLELPGYLKSNPTSIGIISTSDRNAQEAADILIDGGIKGIWNCTHLKLRVPQYIAVENVYIGQSLMFLSYKLKKQNITKSTLQEKSV
jgi:redox-sensing transcriptional repressor